MNNIRNTKGSSAFKLLRRTIYRYKHGSETLRSLALRIPLLPRRYIVRQQNVLDRKWDFLILLDACRYDAFQEVNTIPGELKCINSVGTHTVEWLKNTFSNRKADDLIYISGNPQMSPFKLEEWVGSKNPFYHFENVWDYGWDSIEQTVKPEKVMEAAMVLGRKHPKRRMIIHYLQPHAPFIGDIRFDMDEKELKIFNTTDWSPLFGSKDTLDLIWEAYKSNLSYVLGHVSKLIKNLKEGEVIITSDHGEMFGKYGIYGHMPAFYSDDLLKVPWLKVDRNKL